MNADGSGQRRLSTGSQHGYEPSWSPDGTKIVFQYRGLFILNIPTGEIARLSLTREGDNLKNRYFVKPSWSPNGEWVAFLNEDGFLGDIYLVRPDGTDLTRLTNSNDISRDGNLVWSPDGRQIAFSAERDGRIEIYILNIEDVLQGGDHQRQVTNTPKMTRNLVTSWSPDSSKIAFSSTRDGNTEIYLMDVDGRALIRLTNNPASDAEPAWSPDGKLIVFSSNRNGNDDIYILDVEEALQGTGDGNARQVTDSPNTDAGPVWSPAP
jgi:Tol biopolymer transport system component